jgi:hypothetical protein
MARDWWYDLLAGIGLLALGCGLWLWWPPAALMVTGALLLLLATLGAWRRGGA